MKICYFGGYDKDYPRTRILMKGLKKNGVEIIECHELQKFLPNKFKLINIPRFLSLVAKHSKLKDYDAMIVGYPGWYDMPIARLLTNLRGKPIIFDAFTSMYETIYTDFPEKRKSLLASFLWKMDKISCELANIIILNTNLHSKYFSKEFGIDIHKFRRVFVGTDDDVFYPRKSNKHDDIFLVYFHGTHIPRHHGIEYILKAAKILEKQKRIKFRIVGYKQTDTIIQKFLNGSKLKNIELIEKWIPYEKLPILMKDADACLGVFGTSMKTKRVIANKLYEIIAMGKPLIHADVPAIKEAGIENKKNALLCKAGDPKGIVNSIVTLMEDSNLKRKISRNGYKLFKKRFTTRAIGKDFKKVIEDSL